jgi:ligand-binding SRPBCC domain-containing protein
VADNAKNILFQNPALLKWLAKYTVQQCFRNKVIEEFHAGTVPDSKSENFSDVVVKTPYGEIPWTSLSRLSDVEMKLVMRDAVNKTFRYLCRLFDERAGGELILRLDERDLAPQLNDQIRFEHDLTGAASSVGGLAPTTDSLHHSQLDPVIRRVHQILLGSEVTLRGLD